ncbi:putative Lysine-specific histone demethylase 1 [Cocos nucifera]|nr:putative Lysine-specific histone demethylase 1 [Cocos nucifera]
MRSPDGATVAAAADLGGRVLTGVNGDPLGKILARQLVCFPLQEVREKRPLYLPDGRPVVNSRVEASFNDFLNKVCKLHQAITDELKSVDVSLSRHRPRGLLHRPMVSLPLWKSGCCRIGISPTSIMPTPPSLSNLSMGFWEQDDPSEMGDNPCFIPRAIAISSGPSP